MPNKIVASSGLTPYEFHTQDIMGRITDITKSGEIFTRYGDTIQGLATVYGYNDRSELTSEQTKIGGTATVLTGRDDMHVYDPIGNRSSVTHNASTSTYSLNSLNQYTARTVPGIFDVAGGAAAAATVTVNGSAAGIARHGEYFFKGEPMTNDPSPIFSSLAVSDGTTTMNLPVFLAGTPEAMTYDEDGNLTRDGRWVYQYDAENRLIAQFTRGAPDDPLAADASNVALWNSGVARQKLLYAYDYLGRRCSKAVANWDGAGSVWMPALSHQFIYDGWNLMAEIDAASGSITRSIIWGLDLSGTMQGAGGVGGLLMTQEGGQTYLPLYDAMGNVYGMVKALDGTLAAAYEYDAFGNTLRESGPYAASNPIRFSTKYTDTETGLVYYGHRYYSPSLGRFINKDPIEEQGGLNLYGFCQNNGVNRCDYLGMVDIYNYNTGDLGAIYRSNPMPVLSPRVSQGLWGAWNTTVGVTMVVSNVAGEVYSGGIASPFAVAGISLGATQAGMGFTQFMASVSNGPMNTPGNMGDVVRNGTDDPLLGAATNVGTFIATLNPSTPLEFLTFPDSAVATINMVDNVLTFEELFSSAKAAMQPSPVIKRDASSQNSNSSGPVQFNIPNVTPNSFIDAFKDGMKKGATDHSPIGTTTSGTPGVLQLEKVTVFAKSGLSYSDRNLLSNLGANQLNIGQIASLSPGSRSVTYGAGATGSAYFQLGTIGDAILAAGSVPSSSGYLDAIKAGKR